MCAFRMRMQLLAWLFKNRKTRANKTILRALAIKRKKVITKKNNRKRKRRGV